MTGPLDETRRRAASRILALSRQFARRSRDAEAALVREFQDAAREHVAALGPLTIEDDDDEQLVLTTDGRFQGRVRVTSDGATTWRSIAAASDVVDYYEPVDLFADLSGAVLEQYPEVEEGTTVDADAAPAAPAASVPDDGSGWEGESPSRRILRDLHDTGVYSDADYAAKLAELDRQSGA